MGDFVMLVYETYDSENPYKVYYTGDIQGAIDYAKGENAFEVDIYEGTRINPDSECVCGVLSTGELF